MRTLSAIVLLIWAVCYGRCLREQNGGTAPLQKPLCAHKCCEQEERDPTPNAPSSPCGVCEFLKSGVVLPSFALAMDVPVFYELESWEPTWVFQSVQLVDEEMSVQVADIGPPFVARMCEWMARTAAPVRGPNAWV